MRRDKKWGEQGWWDSEEEKILRKNNAYFWPMGRRTRRLHQNILAFAVFLREVIIFLNFPLPSTSSPLFSASISFHFSWSWRI